MVFIHGAPHAVLRCETCDGEREVAVRSCDHSGGCPCGPDWIPCSACDGRGVAPCWTCWQRNVVTDAVTLDEDGYPACNPCAAWSERERLSPESRIHVSSPLPAAD